MELNIVLDYVDEVLVLDPESVEEIMNKLEYIRNYFVVDCYDRNLEILKMINKIIDLYYMKNHYDFKDIYNELRELIMKWIKYEKTIS